MDAPPDTPVTPAQTIPPGTFGLSQITGLKGFLIGLGQYLAGDGSRYTHAFLALDDGTVIEAMPAGAQLASLQERLTWKPLVWARSIPLTDEQRAQIVREARLLLGAKYGFSDYLAIALARFGWHPRWLTNYIARNDRVICSQLIDLAYNRAGIHLFDDGRPCNQVTPGDLANLLIERDWT